MSLTIRTVRSQNYQARCAHYCAIGKTLPRVIFVDIILKMSYKIFVFHDSAIPHRSKTADAVDFSDAA